MAIVARRGERGKDGATALRTKLKVLQACVSPQPAHRCQHDASPPSQSLSLLDR